MKKILTLTCILMGCALMIIIGCNAYVCLSTKDQFHKELNDADCILVLGAGVRNERPTPMLNDRLLTAIDLYQNKKAPKIIMSGDHGRENYDEVNIMKKFAIEKGIPSSDIFMDHAGFSTYESLYRLKEVFLAKKVIIVTQDYHLYRALYIANQLGIDAVGIPSNLRPYPGQLKRDVREIAARIKDVFTCFIQPKPTYLGESIPVSGDGDITNDQAI